MYRGFVNVRPICAKFYYLHELCINFKEGEIGLGTKLTTGTLRPISLMTGRCWLLGKSPKTKRSAGKGPSVETKQMSGFNLAEWKVPLSLSSKSRDIFGRFGRMDQGFTIECHRHDLIWIYPKAVVVAVKIFCANWWIIEAGKYTLTPGCRWRRCWMLFLRPWQW